MHSRLTLNDLFCTQESNPPLAIHLNGSQRLAIASEKGCLFIADTKYVKIVEKWQAHSNAIFDVKWRPGSSNQLLTVSGDQSFTLWDLNQLSAASQSDSNKPCEGIWNKNGAHLSSIKTCSFMDQNNFATGSRDGNIHIWDSRIDPCQNDPQISISDAHLSVQPTKRASKKNPPAMTRSRPTSAVTALLFHPDTPFLYSSGANDARIKLWDIRNIKMVQKLGVRTKQQLPVAAKIFKYYEDESSSAHHGFSSMAFDSSFRLYACCSDQRIYCYDPSTTNILAAFSGHRSNNWTGISVMNDFLISGSTDSSSRIWSLNLGKNIFSDENRKVYRPIVLLPHNQEVGSVGCDPSNYQVYTCTDDQKVHKWSLFGRLNLRKGDDGFDPHVLRAISYEAADVEIEMIKTPKVTNNDGRTPSSVLTPINNFFPPLRRSSEARPPSGVKKKSETEDQKVLQDTPRTEKKRKSQVQSTNPLSSKKVRKISDYYSPIVPAFKD